MRVVEEEAARRQLDELHLDYWSFNDRVRRLFASLGYAPYNIRAAKLVAPPLCA